MTTKYRNIYGLLKRAGHSPCKAFEIILDAHRGDRHAMLWIKAAFFNRVVLR